MNIICLSTQDFDEPIWTNKQHIMSRLSKEHNVIYVDINPLPYEELFVRKPWDIKSKIDRIKNWVQKREHNLWVCTNFMFGFFNNFRKLEAFDRYFERKMHERILAVKKFVREQNFRDLIVWVYWPPYEKFLDEFDRAFVVYDCVDEYTAFPDYQKGEKYRFMKKAEENLLKKAHLVVASSPKLYEEKKKLNRNTYLVPNVGDAGHFSKARDPQTRIPDDISKIKHPIIGFVGAVSGYKVNLPLLEAIAQAKPEWSLVLIGPAGSADPGTDLSRLKKLKNVHLLGLRKYETLPDYIKAFDVCTIPYNINAYTENCFPIKFFEFMATGKPVVVTNLPALEPFSGIVKYAHNDREFIKYIEEVLEKDSPEAKEARIKIAGENSWNKRINGIMELIKSHHAPSR